MDSLNKTANAPQETANAPQTTASAPQSTASVPTDGASAYQGGQAELKLHKGKVLKVYKPRNGFNATVMPLVKKMKGQGYVVDLYDYGTMDYEGEPRQFELMEHCPQGAVSGVDLRGNPDAILAIVRKIAQALDACHRAGFIHKDVKPANILIRDKNTWDCVLCDFGIADVLENGKSTTLQSRTPTYAAPEVYERNVTIANKTYCQLTPAADFYSLGMTILCLWYGESAFRSKEPALAIQKVHDGIIVPTDIPDPLFTITRGLLVKDHAHRWGWNEIQDFLNGVKAEVYDEHREGGLKIIYNNSKQQVAHSIKELAAFMADDLDLAIKYLYSGKISKWLEHIPELQIEMENIVEKTYANDPQKGVLAAIHTLNPFCDLKLCGDPNDPSYAMTGVTLGQVINQAYHHYFTLNDAGVLDRCIAESFSKKDNNPYVPWFLNQKGKRFQQQLSWFNYCVVSDSRNSKKAGPKDQSYLHQVAMMKTIAGFGASPEYHLSRTGHTLRNLKDVYRAPKKELLFDLKNDKGLRGWLAVLCHENPHADLKKKYNYEKLLEQYVELLGYIDPDDTAYKRFHQAQDEAGNLISSAKNSIRGVRTTSLVQKLMAFFLGFIPIALLLTRIILNIIDNPSIDMSGSWGTYLFYGLGLVAAAIAYFALDSDGCLVPVIIGAVVSFLATLLVAVIGYVILYIFGVAALAALVFFGIATLFASSENKTQLSSITNPGFEELTLEPLYYAFSKENSFDSSLNGATNIKSSSRWREDVRKRWLTLILFIGSSIILNLFGLLLPQSDRMERFDNILKKPFKTETTQHDSMQELPDPEP